MVSTKEMLYGKPAEGWKPNTKLLYATATANGWNHEGVKRFIKAAFNRDSTKDLEYSEYQATMEMVGNPYEETE